MQKTRVRELDAACGGMPVGALAQLTGRHSIDIDLFVDALRRADPNLAIIDVDYAVVTKKYRTVIEELRSLHAQRRAAIVRCSPAPEFE